MRLFITCVTGNGDLPAGRNVGRTIACLKLGQHVMCYVGMSIGRYMHAQLQRVLEDFQASGKGRVKKDIAVLNTRERRTLPAVSLIPSSLSSQSKKEVKKRKKINMS